MSKLLCPYCGAEQEADVDYQDSDTIYEQECDKCEKVFGYEVVLHCTERKLPCRNGHNHDWVKVNGYPRVLYANMHKCSYCGQFKREV